MSISFDQGGQGTLLERSTGGAIPAQAPLQYGGLTLPLHTGSTVNQLLRVVLEREESSADTSTNGKLAEDAAATSGTPKMPDGRLDPVLVGSWSQSNSYNSGDFTAVSRNAITLMPDGRVLDGGSQVIGGGGMGGFDFGADMGGSQATGALAARFSISTWEPVASAGPLLRGR